jgi:hypothetical protein
MRVVVGAEAHQLRVQGSGVAGAGQGARGTDPG